MTREILKFRAWDVLNKKMSFWTMNDLCNHTNDSEKPSCLEEWMQFTGLKDKNGKEIYEGDILLQKSTHISREVFWNEKRGCFSVTDRVKPHKHKVADYCHGAEIIGNIYEGLHSGENPELLSN